jgi:hypothetical protein
MIWESSGAKWRRRPACSDVLGVKIPGKLAIVGEAKWR